MTIELEESMTVFQRCIEERDQGAAERILDDGYALVLVQPSPAVMPRQRWLDVLGDYVVHSYEVEEQVVDVDGDCATVLQRVRMTATMLGEDRSGLFIISDVWRLRDGHWRIWRRHSTPLSAGVLPRRRMSDPRGDGSASVVVRRLEPSDFDRYSALRLEGLIECPAAYATDAEAWTSASRSTLEAHLSPDRAPVLGAWVGESLVGLLGMKREERRSVSHKAGLWGFYVAPQHRGQGVGRRLLTEMIGLAAGVPGLRQFRAIVPTTCTEALSLMDALGFERYGLERNARLVDGVSHDQAYHSYSLPEA